MPPEGVGISLPEKLGAWLLPPYLATPHSVAPEARSAVRGPLASRLAEGLADEPMDPGQAYGLPG